MTTQQIISKIEEGKWNGKFYGNSIFINNEKISCNRDELLYAIVKNDYTKADKATRTSLFVSIAKRENLNLTELLKENPDVRIPFDKFSNGEGIDYLYEFFNSLEPIKKDLFFIINFTSGIDGVYTGF